VDDGLLRRTDPATHPPPSTERSPQEQRTAEREPRVPQGEAPAGFQRPNSGSQPAGICCKQDLQRHTPDDQGDSDAGCDQAGDPRQSLRPDQAAGDHDQRNRCQEEGRDTEQPEHDETHRASLGQFLTGRRSKTSCPAYCPEKMHGREYRTPRRRTHGWDSPGRRGTVIHRSITAPACPPFR